jgi:hypothetical protein
MEPESRSHFRRLALLACLAVNVATLTGCPDNPYKAGTWTKKLSDPREAERAVTQLEQLGDPSAIPALGQAWVDQGKPVRLLQVIISLARPLTPEQAKATYMTDFETSGRPASWDAAMPFLKQALTEVDETNPRSVDSAQKAADAVGESQDEDGLDALIDVASKPVTKKLIGAQVSAIRAIGHFDNAKAKAAGALIKLIDKDPPINPRAVKGKDSADEKQAQRAAEEKYGLFLGVTGAAINALGDLRVPSAAKTLVPHPRAVHADPALARRVRPDRGGRDPQGAARREPRGQVAVRHHSPRLRSEPAGYSGVGVPEERPARPLLRRQGRPADRPVPEDVGEGLLSGRHSR